MAAVPDAAATDYRLDEWKEARSVVDAADTRLTDLRKYGLTFVAGLLTAQGLTEIAVGTPVSFVTPIVKLGITVVSLLIICMMVAIEKVNLPLQRAAALRASVIERQLGLKLTQEITEIYDWYKVWRWVFVLYLIFVVSVGLFGLALLMPISFNLSWEIFVEILALASAVLFVTIEWLHAPKTRLTDWSLDRYRCKQGDPPLLLMVTNFTGYRLDAATGFVLWRVEGTPPKVTLNGSWKEDDKPIGNGESRLWTIDTSDLPVGSYYLWVAQPKLKPQEATECVLTSSGSAAVDKMGRHLIETYSKVTFNQQERFPVPIAVTR